MTYDLMTGYATPASDISTERVLTQASNSIRTFGSFTKSAPAALLIQ